MPASVINTILTRAEGNPFYIEEFVRMLIEKELLHLVDNRWRVISTVALEKLDIPPSLHSMMMARVDRLPDNLRNVLRDAAVIGLEFDERILGQIEYQLHGTTNVKPYLERLTEAELLETRPQVSPYTYGFRHMLTQEAIYNSILHTQRPTLHGVIAETISSMYHDDLDNQAEVLARHYDQARIRDKALTYSLLAGDRARARYANREATEYYSRTLQLSQHLTHCEAERWHAAIGLADVQQHVGEYEEAIAFYLAALEERKDAPAEAQAEVMLKLGQTWGQRGALEEAETWLHHGLTRLAEVTDQTPHIEAEINALLGWISLRRGDLPKAQVLLEEALTLVDDTQHYGVLSSILNYLGTVYHTQGNWDRAAQTVERALAICEELGDLPGVARSYTNLGALKSNNGNWQGALEDYRHSLRVLAEIGDNGGIAIAHANTGNVYIDMGAWEQAEDHLRQSVDIAQRIANPYQLAQAHLNLGRLYLMSRQTHKVQQNLDAAISLYKQAGGRTNAGLIDAYCLQGQLCLERGDTNAATTWGDRIHILLQEVSGEMAVESIEWGHYEQLMGRIALSNEAASQALIHFERSKTIFRTNKTLVEVGRTAYWIARTHQKLKEPHKSQAELVEAECIFAQLGAQHDLELVKTALAAQGSI